MFVSGVFNRCGVALKGAKPTGSVPTMNISSLWDFILLNSEARVD
jgi:hypothetical protein